MSALNVYSLNPGDRAEVTYRLAGQRVDRVMVARFIGADDKVSWWDLRPVAGTTQLPIDSIGHCGTTDRAVAAPKAVGR